MADTTALDTEIITEKSGHNCVGMAVSVCITPAAPAPLPMPYPTTGSMSEGSIDPAMRTKIDGAPIVTVGSCMKVCHGNEPGTLKEVVSLNTGGPTFPIMGAPTVLIELGMAGITGSPAQMNKAITVGAPANASDASGGSSAGNGAGSDGSANPDGGNTSNPSQSGSGSGGDASGASASAAPVSADHEAQAKALSDPKKGIKVRPEDVALAAHPNLSEPPPKAQVDARKKVASAFYRKNGKTYATRDENGVPYGKDANGKPIKQYRDPTHDERKSELACTNYNQPVTTGPPPACQSPMSQWQTPGNDRGGYYADKSTQPEQLGIAPQGKAWSQPGQPVVPKQSSDYNVNPNAPYMQSTSSPANDTWSVPGQSTPTPGGGQQTYIPSGSDPNSTTVSPA